MKKHRTSEELLDEISLRIRQTAVPDYPGPQLLSALAAAVTEVDGKSPFSRLSTRRQMITVSCSVAVLLLLAVGQIFRSDVDRVSHQSHRASQGVESRVTPGVATVSEPGDLTIGPVQVVTFNTTTVFKGMLDELDRLDARLQVLTTEVTLQEVRTDAAMLLAQYAPRESTVR
jgi:hypothetical protein